jgi:uncharacterized protein (DUF433 family)
MSSASLPKEDLLYPIEVLADAAGIDRARAKHWAEESLELPYAIRQRTSAARQVRMLDWTAALEFMLVAAMRSEHDVPFQRVHDFLEVAGDLLPQVDLLDVRVEPETRHLFWRVGDDPWEGTDSPHQYRFASMVNLVPLVRDRLKRVGSRTEDQHGQIVKTRGVQHSRPCFAGTRITVDTVHEWLEAGVDHNEILRQYPTLVQADIDAAEALLAKA